jgi:hypothetical protein
MPASINLGGTAISHTGPAPYTARSASDRDNLWPLWIVVDAVGFNGVQVQGRTQKLFSKTDALRVAAALNEEAA